MQDWIVLSAIAAMAVACIASTVVMLSYVKSQQAERRDMLDRLMSKDLVEYKELTAVESVSEPGIPVSLSDEEEWAREVEMMRRAGS